MRNVSRLTTYIMNEIGGELREEERQVFTERKM
jgi:hypothetical protein